MKILILLLYYDRPNMVENALASVVAQTYQDWELAVIDDGSQRPGKEIAQRMLSNDLNKVRFYSTQDSVSTKIANGGSRIGKFMNQAISESDAEIAIMLCDDDALLPDYLDKLSKWFKQNQDKMYCHSHVVLFNPFQESPEIDKFSTEWIELNSATVNRYKHPYNKEIDIIPARDGGGGLDASQPAWRTKCNKQDEIWFPFPKTCNLDSALLIQLHQKYGLCSYSGFYGQYKAIFPSALCNRPPHKWYQVSDI